jgi:hypothetical protein
MPSVLLSHSSSRTDARRTSRILTCPDGSHPSVIGDAAGTDQEQPRLVSELRCSWQAPPVTPFWNGFMWMGRQGCSPLISLGEFPYQQQATGVGAATFVQPVSARGGRTYPHAQSGRLPQPGDTAEVFGARLPSF